MKMASSIASPNQRPRAESSLFRHRRWESAREMPHEAIKSDSFRVVMLDIVDHVDKLFPYHPKSL
jgi:hypothetical protein